MRISKEETAANRAKVLAAAARLFREKGVDGIAVAELMQAAGLTHGGFYNHFESKEELAAAAFREAFAAAVNRVERQAAEADRRGRDSAFAHYVGRYLAPETRDAPGTSCPMATLGTDAARHGSELRGAFADGVRRYIEAFAKIVPGESCSVDLDRGVDVVTRVRRRRRCAGRRGDRDGTGPVAGTGSITAVATECPPRIVRHLCAWSRPILYDRHYGEGSRF